VKQINPPKDLQMRSIEHETEGAFQQLSTKKCRLSEKFRKELNRNDTAKNVQKGKKLVHFVLQIIRTRHENIKNQI
jgi:hypothetical protein